ncbi:MAG: HAD family hydrolase [Oligoflexales bacterium]
MINLIWDFGKVLFNWEPQKICKKFFLDVHLANLVCSKLIEHPDWLALDAGTISLKEFIAKASRRVGISEETIEEFITIHLPREICLLPDPFRYVKLFNDKHISQYFLTNMAHHVFAYIDSRYQISSFFKGGVVSAKELCIKPDTKIYQILTSRYNLDPKTCVFIDDRPENISAAKECGIVGIQFTEFVHFEKKLQSFMEEKAIKIA